MSRQDDYTDPRQDEAQWTGSDRDAERETYVAPWRYDTREEKRADLLVPDRTSELYKFFDSVRLLGIGMATLFEKDCPGATAALRTWAASFGFLIEERFDDDGIAIEAVTSGGQSITVHRAHEGLK